MKTPAFWYKKPGTLAWFLWPLGWIYGQVTARRMAKSGTGIDLPVICVGNFTAGGAGNTPTVLMLAEALRKDGERPFVISRGYGGKFQGPVRVDPDYHTASDCGDEPLLLAAQVPTVVAKDRVAGAAFAKVQGATVLLLDDGLQNPALSKDFTIAVVDSAVGVGNRLCVPAGPLRAPLLAQLPYVDAVLMVGRVKSDLAQADLSQTNQVIITAAHTANKPVFLGQLQPDADAVGALRGLRLLAFAGIGRPEKFFETLRQAGLDVVQTKAFADHHPYSEADIIALRRQAAFENLSLVTTEKDMARLQSSKVDIKCLPIQLELADEALLGQLKQLILIRRLKL